MMNLNAEWTQTRLALEGRLFEAYRRQASGAQNWDSFVSEKLKSVVDEGGVLLQSVKTPEGMGAVANPGGIIGYQYELPKTELWYLPQCSFEQSLELLNVFGFPTERICSDPETVRVLTNNLLQRTREISDIALTLVRPEFVMVERINADVKFTLEQIDSVMQFNRRHFRLQHDAVEIEDIKANYQAKGFFVIGLA